MTSATSASGTVFVDCSLVVRGGRGDLCCPGCRCRLWAWLDSRPPSSGGENRESRVTPHCDGDPPPKTGTSPVQEVRSICLCWPTKCCRRYRRSGAGTGEDKHEGETPRSRDRLALASTRPHRGRVVFIPSGTDHPAQNHHPVPADVPRCVDAFLRHHAAVDHHLGARFADGDVELKTRVPSRATSATLACGNGSEQVERSVM